MPSPEQLRILTVIFFAALLLLGVWRPVFAVAAYMVLVYCKMSYYFPVFTQIRAESLFAVLILARVIATGHFFKNISLSTSKINRYVFYMVLCVVLSFVVAWDHQYSWDMAVYHFIKTLVLYVLILGSIENENDLKIFIWSFMLMFLYLAYEPAYGFVTGTGGSRQMYGTNFTGEAGILAGHVALANNMNQMLPLAWFLFLGSTKKWARILAAVSFSVFFLALVGSGSRGGIVGMLVWGCMIVWFARERAKTIALLLPILLILFVTQGSSVLHTASRIDSSSTESRLLGLTHGLGMLRHGNLIGVGPGCYLFAREKYFSYRMEAHNIYGQIMGDLGIPGMIVTFLLMREIFRTIVTVKQRAETIGEEKKFILYLMTGVQVSLITRLVGSMASHGLYYFYWYVMAALVISSQRLLGNGQTLVGEKDNSEKSASLAPLKINGTLDI